MIRLIFIIILFFLIGCEEKEEVSSDGETEPAAEAALQHENSLLSPDRFLNIAHRGASGYAPEHTLVSYQMGEDMAADYIEIDLQMTKDKTLIAMHDSDISRTTEVSGSVKDFSLEEIKVLDVGSWFNAENREFAQPVFNNTEIPTLDEILEEFGQGANYYIETKSPKSYPGMVEELLRVLHQHDLIDSNTTRPGQVIIQSFDEASLLEVKEREPSLPLIRLISYVHDEAEITDKEIEKIKGYAAGIGVNYKSLTKEYVEKVVDAGLLIHPYTVNEKAEMERLINWGVTGIFTDYPDRLNEVLGRE